MELGRSAYHFRITPEVANSLRISIAGDFIRTLELKGSTFTAEIIRSLGDGLRKTNALQELTITQSTVQSNEEANLFANMIRIMRVPTLVLCGNQDAALTDLHKKIFQALKSNTIIRTLLIRSTPLDIDEINVLFNAVKENVSLGCFILSGVAQIGQNNAKILQEILETKKNITTINLINCNIDNQICEYLAEGLKNNRTLTQLDLSENHINSSGITPVFNSLKTNTSLKTLVLSDNSDFSVKGLTALKDMLAANNTLRKLWLSNCYNPREENEVDLICSGLRLNTSLTFVDLYSIDIPDDIYTYIKFCSAIENVLDVNHALREVQQYKNNDAIKNQLKRNRDLQGEMLFNVAILVLNIMRIPEPPMNLPKELWLEIFSQIQWPGLDLVKFVKFVLKSDRCNK